MSYVRPGARVIGEDFSRGFRDTPETDTLPAGATPDARNAILRRIEAGEQRRATMAKRAGSRLINATALAATKAVDGLVEFRREAAAPKLLAACNGAWSVYDDVSTFSAIAGATGYTAGRPARAVFFKNQAWLHDGTAHQLYDGTTVRPVGFAKPTGVTNMSAGSSPGVTGTFTARYTWYDQTHDHESSPTEAATASLVCTDDQRVHTKPSGSPPAHVTHWRVYVRREDTSEVYWMRVATVAIGTTTHSEAVIDAARRDPLPGESANDPPSFVPALAVVWKGYGIAFPSDSSTMHVATQGDIEAWNPRNAFKVSPGDGEPVRLAKTFGSECLVMKPHASFQLLGSKLPFDIEPVHSAFGCVSQDAGLEVLGRFFAWDAVKGPYWTDLSTWQPIGDFAIEGILADLNRAQLAGIVAVHDEANSLVIWAIPTTGSARRRMLLAYHYLIGTWLPPITGLEYASLTQYTTNAGALGVYLGDYWGRVYQLFDGDRDGPATGTVRGTVTAATNSTLTDENATFYTAGSGLAGVPVMACSPSGSCYWRRIASNTATTLTLDTTTANAWSVTPQAGWTYAIGGIDWYWKTGWLDFGLPGVVKALRWLSIQLKPTSGTHEVDVRVQFNENDGATVTRRAAFSAGAPGGVWGAMVWGEDVWGATVRRMRKLRLMRTCFSLSIQFRNPYPDEPVELTRYQVDADPLVRRRSPGGEG